MSFKTHDMTYTNQASDKISSDFDRNLQRLLSQNGADDRTKKYGRTTCLLCTCISCFQINGV